MTTPTRPPVPPFDEASARHKVLAAEAAWNTRDPERVAGAYTIDSVWRNRSEFVEGRDQIIAFLRAKWERELDYALRKDLWAFHDNRIAVRFQYEWHDTDGRWFRSYGNENWEFDEHGLMRRREASINDVAITATDRRIFGPRSDGDTSGFPLR
jgi:nuclear transport factor 2 (NTF2) superfamily protein